MLCQFSFQNFKSYRGETTFDFLAVAIPEFAESLLTCRVETKENKEIEGVSLLPVGVVYGPNGGGKSNSFSKELAVSRFFWTKPPESSPQSLKFSSARVRMNIGFIWLC